MKDAAESLFIFSNGCLRFFFLGNVQENALPIKGIPISVTDEICILLDPNRSPVTSYEPVLFEKSSSVIMRFLISFINSLPVLGVYGIEPYIWDFIPFIWFIACHFKDPWAHIKCSFRFICSIQKHHRWNLFHQRLVLNFCLAQSSLLAQVTVLRNCVTYYNG